MAPYLSFLSPEVSFGVLKSSALNTSKLTRVNSFPRLRLSAASAFRVFGKPFPKGKKRHRVRRLACLTRCPPRLLVKQSIFYSLCVFFDYKCRALRNGVESA